MVSFICVLPVLAVFLCAIVDVGRVVVLHMALNDAAHVACQTVVEGASGASSTEAIPLSQVRSAAIAAAPSLAGGGVSLDVSVDYGSWKTLTYQHYVYDEGDRSFTAKTMQAQSREVVVDVSLEGTYATPVGALMAQAAGRDDAGFTFTATARGSIDGIT